MASGTGFLTIYSADRSEIYGEFADAEWREETTGDGVNRILSGKASDGTLATFQRIDEEGISNLSYKFEGSGEQFEGQAQLLALQVNSGQGLIQIESTGSPS